VIVVDASAITELLLQTSLGWRSSVETVRARPAGQRSGFITAAEVALVMSRNKPCSGCASAPV
jgi:hypothetical protein